MKINVPQDWFMSRVASEIGEIGAGSEDLFTPEEYEAFRETFISEMEQEREAEFQRLRETIKNRVD